MSRRDTIFALSSGPPPAAIAVVRISGPSARAALEAVTGRVPKPRHAAFARLRDPDSGEIIDEALALWFPGPSSETGEDVAELQIHGGRAVIAATLDALSRVDGLRPAEAGEFTRRAFENGKLDLTRVEGLADLIGAETEAQRRQALRQLRGLLGDRAETWRKRLTEALALVEAEIDFPDEGDIPQNLLSGAADIARELVVKIEETIRNAKRSERLRDGMCVAICGAPNAGKSSLLNALVRRDAAIVSPIAGTTRDLIEIHLDLEGYPVTVVDTAGLRDSNDPIEQEGVRRALARARDADLILWVVDGTDQTVDSEVLKTAKIGGAEVWYVLTRRDLPEFNNIKSEISNIIVYGFAVSSSTGEGLPALVTAMEDFAARYFAGNEAGLIGRARQRMSLEEASRYLNDALSHRTAEIEVFAEDLRLAARALGRLTGRIDVEDVLDVIFRDFCIGK